MGAGHSSDELKRLIEEELGVYFYYPCFVSKGNSAVCAVICEN